MWTSMEKSVVIWDDQLSDSKFRCVAKIVLSRWKYCRCYLGSETLKSNTSRENLHSQNLIEGPQMDSYYSERQGLLAVIANESFLYVIGTHTHTYFII